MTPNPFSWCSTRLPPHVLAATQEHAVPPTIGVPLSLDTREDGSHLCTDATCAWAIALLGGHLLFVPLWPLPPPDPPFAACWPLISALDGLLLPAGGLACGDQAEWAAAWQVALVQVASWVGLPILALGEGARTWHAALSTRSGPQPAGSEPAEVPALRWPRKVIRARTGSRLAGWLAQQAPAPAGTPEPPFALPVLPGAGVEPLTAGLRGCARTQGGRLIAFERRDAAFGLGMLARLDWGLDQGASQQIFAAFLEAARHFALARARHPDWQGAGASICSALCRRLAARLPLLTGEQERTTEPLPRLDHAGRPAREAGRRPPSPQRTGRAGTAARAHPQGRQAVPLPQ